MKKHNYKTKVEWTGNLGKGTLNYTSYERQHTISVEGKYQEILASSDPSFLGNKTRYNPEELFLASISTCHMLWFLHLCSTKNIVVSEYVDNATGVMEETKNGSGRFTKVILHPFVKIDSADKIKLANELHEEANKMCFIANSCNFDIGHHPNTFV